MDVEGILAIGLGERMDFAERMLAQSREQALLKGGSGRA